ncbi:hypothetical protein GMOD_00008326 [Pyrenophora seminiperda CCB06]|uniref:Uncharacterized protein n=1 Tax=Pyrenophora seminiperda CCB06 TaxID=1302712 RepID=A0A3M7M285_9PLEO|nr:hypothetical protein GMOD_00008326 [Pyrenophora seminiperda CCB06]
MEKLSLLNSLHQEPKASLHARIRHSIDCPLNMFSSVKLLVQPPEDDAHDNGHDNRQRRRCTVHTQRQRQVRLSMLWLRIHVARINRTRVTNRIDECQRCCPLCRRSWQ